MNPELAALKNVVTRLEHGGFSYMLTGSMALSFYVAPRMTRDIDLVIDVASPRTAELVAIFDEDYYVSAEAVREAADLRGMFNVLYLPGSIKIDLIVRKDSPYRREEFGRRNRTDRLGFPLWVVSREDLILSKLVWARNTRSELQFGDVRALLAGEIDRDYLERWALELEVAEDLKACIDARHGS